MYMFLTDEQVKMLEDNARNVRVSIIEMLAEAKSGHTGGPLGMADIFTALYFNILKHDPARPDWPERDRLVLSNGHICPVLYSAMAHSGYFPVSELLTLRKFGSRLQGHPHREFLPSLETSSGPLGSGLSQAVGMAIADRMDYGKVTPRFIYCMLGDGELNEGQNWEAMMLAGKEKLGNLIAIVDRNHIQIDGFTEDIMPLSPLYDKWKSFGWHVLQIDGHDMRAIVGAVREAQAMFEKPSVILAHTIPGKGVSYMEHRFEWHGTPPGISDIAGAPEKAKQVEVALSDLRAELPVNSRVNSPQI
ncbi:MAG: transketolase [Candidatus Pacebacteria bacterium]|nr:transketolase [Candidatus Paceibacterota bacterium]